MKKVFVINLVVDTYCTAEIPADNAAEALKILNSREYRKYIRDDYEFTNKPDFDVKESDFACEDDDDDDDDDDSMNCIK